MKTQRRIERAHGATMVQFVLVIPVVLLTIFSLIEIATYLVARGMAESAAQQALSQAAIMPGLEDADAAGLQAAETELTQVVRKQTTTAFLKDYIDKAGESCSALGCVRSVDVEFQENPDLTLEQNLVNNPITISVESEYRPLTSFLFPGVGGFTIATEVKGYREPRFNSSLPLAADCNGIVGGPNENCPCPSDLGNSMLFVGDDGQCDCQPGLRKVDNGDGSFSCECPGDRMQWDPNNKSCECILCPSNSASAPDSCACHCNAGFEQGEGDDENCYCKEPRIQDGAQCNCPPDPSCPEGSSPKGPNCECDCDDPEAEMCGGECVTCPDGLFVLNDCSCGVCESDEVACGNSDPVADCYSGSPCTNGTVKYDDSGNCSICECQEGFVECSEGCVQECDNCTGEVMNFSTCTCEAGSSGHELCGAGDSQICLEDPCPDFASRANSTWDEESCTCKCDPGFDPFVGQDGLTRCKEACPVGQKFDENGNCICEDLTCPSKQETVKIGNQCVCACNPTDTLNCQIAGGDMDTDTCECTCPDGGQYCDSGSAAACVPVTCSDPRKEPDLNECGCVCKSEFPRECGEKCYANCPTGQTFECSNGTADCKCPSGETKCTKDGLCYPKCQSGKKLSEDTCQCDCINECKGGTLDPGTCGCTCPSGFADCKDTCTEQCPNGQRFDDACGCECKPDHSPCDDGTCKSCPDNKPILNSASCECECDPSIECTGGKKKDDDCNCVCPLGTTPCMKGGVETCIPNCEADGFLPNPNLNCECSACEPDETECKGSCVPAECPIPGQERNPETCTCHCPENKPNECKGACYADCPGEQVRNSNSCKCECPGTDGKTERCKDGCFEPCPEGFTRQGSETCECSCPVGQEQCNGKCVDTCDRQRKYGQVLNDKCECECWREEGSCNIFGFIDICFDDSVCIGGKHSDFCLCECEPPQVRCLLGGGFGTYWDGVCVEPCPHPNQVYDADCATCICPDTSHCPDPDKVNEDCTCACDGANNFFCNGRCITRGDRTVCGNANLEAKGCSGETTIICELPE